MITSHNHSSSTVSDLERSVAYFLDPDGICLELSEHIQ